MRKTKRMSKLRESHWSISKYFNTGGCFSVLVCQGFKIMPTQPKTTDADLTTKSPHDIRIKRSFESSTLSQSTQHTLEVTSKSENLSDLQTESLISSKTVQTENESLQPTTTTKATKSTTTATKSTTTMFNQSKENGKDIQCPLWLYSGNDSKTKLYGMLEKPCWSESLQELDLDDTRHYIRLYEERLYETIDMTGTLINNIVSSFHCLASTSYYLPDLQCIYYHFW